MVNRWAPWATICYFPLPYIPLLPCFRQIKGSEERKSLMVHVRVTSQLWWHPLPPSLCRQAVMPGSLQSRQITLHSEAWSFALSWRAVGFVWHTWWDTFFLSYPRTGSRPVSTYDSLESQHITFFYIKPGKHCSGVGIKNHKTWSATQVFCSDEGTSISKERFINQQFIIFVYFWIYKQPRRDSRIFPEIWS